MLSIGLIMFGAFALALVLKVSFWLGKVESRKPLPPPIDTSCRLWEVRHTQLKMLDAGIITDEEMSICDNENCRDCATTKKSLRLMEETNRRLNAIKSQNEYRKEKELERRYRQIGESSIPIPDSVPDYAHLETLYDQKYIRQQARWTWTDPDSGKRMAARSMFLPDLNINGAEPFTRSNAERARRREEKKRRTQLGYA